MSAFAYMNKADNFLYLGCVAALSKSSQAHKLWNPWMRKNCWRPPSLNLCFMGRGQWGSEVYRRPEDKTELTLGFLFPARFHFHCSGLTLILSFQWGAACETSYCCAGCRLPGRHRKCCVSQLSYLTVQLSESDSFFLSISSSLSRITKRQEGHWRTEGTPQERQPVPAVAPSSQLPSWSFILARVICFFSLYL